MIGKKWWLLPVGLVISCSLPMLHSTKSVVVQLDGLEVSCSLPKNGYTEQEKQKRETQASVSIECPTIINASGYSITPFLMLFIEKADSLLDPVIYNNRSRAVYEAKTIAVLSGSRCLLGGAFTETIQQRRFSSVQNTIYQATTTQGMYGIRIVYQVPSDVYDKGFSEIQRVIKTVRISKQ
jgi:hypothetical protein